MGAFLSVARGSEEPPVFLELHYNGCPDRKQLPLMLVGKGVTFDRLTMKYSPLSVTNPPVVFQGAVLALFPSDLCVCV